MSEVFGSAYADSYDILYQDKNYSTECDLIERIFRTYGEGPFHSLLDLGCGTGNHAILLAQRGYRIFGVDRSPDMLDIARRKSGHLLDNGVVFSVGDVRRVDLKQQFDAVLMMFAVLGYQIGNNDVLAALGNARRHVRHGGLLLFDVWYGPAVLTQRPYRRIKEIPTPCGRLVRNASGKLDVLNHVCEVEIQVSRFEKDKPLVETREHHIVRYFFPKELELLLECSGFTRIRLGSFPEFDKEPDETAWNVLGVACPA